LPRGDDALSAPEPKWEDEQRATKDLDLLREEYRRLLYAWRAEEETQDQKPDAGQE
jgi:hypothetical protein